MLRGPSNFQCFCTFHKDQQVLRAYGEENESLLKVDGHTIKSRKVWPWSIVLEPISAFPFLSFMMLWHYFAHAFSIGVSSCVFGFFNIVDQI